MTPSCAVASPGTSGVEIDGSVIDTLDREGAQERDHRSADPAYLPDGVELSTTVAPSRRPRPTGERPTGPSDGNARGNGEQEIVGRIELELTVHDY
jgi:hypothetical protein